MGDFGHTLNYHPIQLEDCNNVPMLDITSSLSDSTDARYQLTNEESTQCLQPANYSDLTNKNVILGTCDASSTFTLHGNNSVNQNAIMNLPDASFSSYILYHDNTSANICGETNHEEKMMSYPGHNATGTPESTLFYFQFYDIVNDVSMGEIMYDNVTIQCRIKYIAEDLYSDGTKTYTTYYIVPNNSNSGLFFSTNNKSNYLYVTFEGRIPDSDIVNRPNLNFLNYSVFTFGLYNSSSDSRAAKVDTTEFANGFHLNSSTSNGTKFRMIPKTNYDKYVFLYQYTDATYETNAVMLSSFVNPHKKIFLDSTTEIYSHSSSNEQTDSQFQFSINPYITESFTSRTREGLTTQFDIQDVKDIYDNIANSTNVFATLQNSEDDINNILNTIKQSIDGNAPKHNGKLAANLESILDIIALLRKNNDEMDVMYIKFNTIFSNDYLPIQSMYGRESRVTNSIPFDVDAQRLSLNQIQSEFQEINRIIEHIKNNRDANEPEFKLDNFTATFPFIHLCIDIIEYFDTNYDAIKNETTRLYDYMPLINLKGSNIYSLNYIYPGIFNSFTTTDTINTNIFDNAKLSSISEFNSKAAAQDQNSLTFFGYDYSVFYNILFSDNLPGAIEWPHMLLPISGSNTNTLMSVYEDWMISQKQYKQAFNHYIHLESLLKYIEDIQTGAYATYQPYINSLNDRCQDFKHHAEYGAETITGNMQNLGISIQMSFDGIMPVVDLLHYYANKIVNDDNDAANFAFCYANIQELPLQNAAINSSTIPDLPTYYLNHDIYLKKANNRIQTVFLTKYNDIFNNALIDADLVIKADSIVSLNDTIFSDTQTNLTYSSEGFQDRYASNKNKFFPNTPNFLHHEYIYSGADTLSIIKDAYAYRDINSDQNYSNFKKYINSVINNPNVDFNTNPAFTCGVSGEEEIPDLSMDFNCGNIGNYWYGPYSQTAISDRCNNEGVNESLQDCDNFTIVTTLELVDEGSTSKLNLVITDQNIVHKITIESGLPLRQDLEPFDTINNINKELITKVSKDGDINGEINLLTKITTDSITSDIDKNKCLSDSDNYTHLYINKDGDLTLQYKHRITKDIIHNGNTMKASIKENDDSGKYASMYVLNDDKFKVGQQIGNSEKSIRGYVGYDGVYHRAENVKSTSHNNQLSNNYKSYSNYCFDGTNAVVETQENSCINDSNCIGLYGTNYKYKITDENKRHLYPCTDTNTYYHKKVGLNTDDPACIRESSQTQVINYDEYLDLTNGDSFNSTQCGYNTLLDSNKSYMEKKRADFQQHFTNMVTTFNALNESELYMLKQTDMKVNEMSTMLKEYKELLQKTTDRRTLMDLSKSQKEDSQQLYQKTQIKSAIVGIGAIVAAIGCFQYMKK